MRCTPDQVIQFTPALISENAAETLEAIFTPEKTREIQPKRKRFPHSRSASSAHLGVNCAANALQAVLACAPNLPQFDIPADSRRIAYQNGMKRCINGMNRVDKTPKPS
jgi:hypothetical protein